MISTYVLLTVHPLDAIVIVFGLLDLQGLPRGRFFCIAVPDGAGPLEVLAVQVPPDAAPQGGERRYARAGYRGRGDARPLVRQVWPMEWRLCRGLSN